MTSSRPLSFFFAASAFAIVGCVLLLPVGAVYVNALSAGNLTENDSLLQASRQVPLLMRSLTVALGAALAALILGVLVGLAASRAGRITRIAMGTLCAASLLTPPYVFAIAWIDLWGPMGWLYRWTPVETARLGETVYSVPGAALALAAAYYPIIAMAAYTAFRRVDRRWREAAAVSGRSRHYLLTIAIPAVVRPIAAGAVAVFLIALYDFPVHSLLQVNTYLVEIYAASEYHDYRAASLLSIPLIVVAAVSIACVRVLLRDRGNRSDAGIVINHSDFDRAWGGWVLLGWAVVAVGSVLPLMAVTTRAMPPVTFVRLFETAWTELATSLILAAIAATIITALGTLSWIVVQHPRLRALVDLLSLVPFLISGPLLGLGLIAIFNRAGPAGAVYDSAAILFLAWTARFGFIAQWGIGAGVRGQMPSGCEAARVAGVSWARTQFGVVIAQARPYLVLVWGAAFVLTFREVDTAVLVAPPGMTLASVRLFTLMHYGPDGYVMAMALTMSLAAFAVGALTTVVAAQWKRITDART